MVRLLIAVLIVSTFLLTLSPGGEGLRKRLLPKLHAEHDPLSGNQAPAYALCPMHYATMPYRQNHCDLSTTLSRGSPLSKRRQFSMSRASRRSWSWGEPSWSWSSPRRRSR